MKPNKLNLITIILVMITMLPLTAFSQYKTDVPTIPGLQVRQPSGAASFLGIDLSKVDFQNSYSMSVSSFGENTVAMGLLKSSFDYVINPQVSVRGFVGLLHTPFSSITPFQEEYSMMQGLKGENIMYGGEVTYRPKENVMFQIGISRVPVSPYRQYNNFMYPYISRGY
ncbi:MAG: hypothetical protein K9M49_02995 [Candidatus Marinimicrobia bacterium]|nr:hypothetical protein [Candidatus Neomarinimicrobiota bacterium]MCF7851457.1 hypothetical protein [Candidatus Neomarinimicrobiota bacterium]MCF7904102.1 hypothetical protein [Candidatus Neomarinimicrobiota bacterium]